MSIDPGRVEEIYRDSLAEDLAPEDVNYVVIEGIVHQTAFDKTKLQAHYDEVAEMLSWLSMQYRPPAVQGGGGWSFLNLCEDKDGHLWTGLHWTMEQLVQVGIGLGLAAWLGPRKLWQAFPGGMPYVSVTLPSDVVPAR